MIGAFVRSLIDALQAVETVFSPAFFMWCSRQRNLYQSSVSSHTLHEE